jgi:hypothetical protein
MRGQEKVYLLPIPEDDKNFQNQSGPLSPSDLTFVSSSRTSLPASMSTAGILDGFLKPARCHSLSDSSASLTPPLASVGASVISMASDSLLTPATSPDEESLEPWIQTV